MQFSCKRAHSETLSFSNTSLHFSRFMVATKIFLIPNSLCACGEQRFAAARQIYPSERNTPISLSIIESIITTIPKLRLIGTSLQVKILSSSQYRIWLANRFERITSNDRVKIASQWLAHRSRLMKSSVVLEARQVEVCTQQTVLQSSAPASHECENQRTDCAQRHGCTHGQGAIPT